MSVEIYGTLGPACDDTGTLEQMFRAGMTGVRLNLSHVTLKDTAAHEPEVNVKSSIILLADDYGYNFAIANGQSPYSMATALEKLVGLANGKQASAVAQMFSSHPDSAKRAAIVRKKADEYTARK